MRPFSVTGSVLRCVSSRFTPRVLHLLACLPTLAAPGANAATLQISPVMVEFEASTNAVGMTLKNPGKEPLYGQVRVYRWSQSSGETELVPTNELVASPPLIQIGGESTQLVRLVRRSAQPVSSEQSYRLLIDELPQAQNDASAGVAIRLRYSVPVFVVPAGPARKPQLTWKLSRHDGHWYLSANNSGGRHAQIAAVTLQAANGTTYQINKGLLGYALVDQTSEWQVGIPDDAPLTGTLVLHAMVNAQDSEAVVSITAAR